MLTHRFAAAIAAVALTLTALASPASADGTGPVDCVQYPNDPTCTIIVVDPGQPGTGGDTDGNVYCLDPHGYAQPCYDELLGWAAADGCYYKWRDAANPPAGAPQPGGWYVRSCFSGADRKGITRTDVWVPNSAGIGPALLARAAMQMLRPPKPSIALSPPGGTPQVVYVPTWLWVASSSFTVTHATARIPGVAQVTATATPVRVVWSTGDGGSVTCHNGGTQWKPGMDPAKPSPTCGHTYTTPSAGRKGGVYTLRATVTWHITWVGAGSSGVAGDLTTTDAITVRAVEASALNTTGD